jgi:hypothetical protein
MDPFLPLRSIDSMLPSGPIRESPSFDESRLNFNRPISNLRPNTCDPKDVPFSVSVLPSPKHYEASSPVMLADFESEGVLRGFRQTPSPQCIRTEI